MLRGLMSSIPVKGDFLFSRAPIQAPTKMGTRVSLLANEEAVA